MVKQVIKEKLFMFKYIETKLFEKKKKIQKLLVNKLKKNLEILQDLK